ncbi:MAG: phospholipase [Gammaproteobacteria bacterium]|nr:phospholipase [Gammaproteobacteria bacterium]
MKHLQKYLILAALLIAAPANATSFSQIVVFGDSLSDVGNLSLTLGGTVPGAPYDNGYFSNGPTWVQTLGTMLGLGPTSPSVTPGGTNYAYGSARTGVGVLGFIPSLITQSNLYLNDVSGVADSNGLYIIWGGGNDVRTNDADTANTATDIASIVSNLIAAGATNFLIPNLPNIGLTPESLGPGDGAPGGDAATMTALTLAHNNALADQVAALAAANPTLNIQLFDVFSIFNGMIDNPESFGFSNVDTRCYDEDAGTVCGNPEEFVFWDGIHPTAAAHAFLGDLAFEQLSSTVVPIPAAVWLFGSALFGLVGVRRRA